MKDDKKPGIFKRAFKYMKDDLSLDNEMKEFAREISEGHIEVEDVSEIDLYNIGERNDVTDEERIRKSFTRGLDSVTKEILENETTDDVFNNEYVAVKISRLLDCHDEGKLSERDSKVIERIQDVSFISQYVYSPLDEIGTKNVDINLQRGETCYLVTQASWKEQKSQTKRVNYGGVGLSLKVVKGVYVRTGTMAAQPVKQNYLADIISGNMYITNKRIIFDSGDNIKFIKISDIMKVVPYSDAIAIHKGTATPALIFTSFNKAVLTLLINKIYDEHLN